MRRILILFFISGLTGLNLSRCKSIPIQQEAAGQIAVNKTAKQTVKESKMTPKEKAIVDNALDGSDKLIEKQSKTIVEKDAKIESLAWYQRFFWYEVAALGTLLIGVGVGWYWRAKKKLLNNVVSTVTGKE